MLAIKIPIREVRSFAILSQFKSNSTSGTLSATLPDIYNILYLSFKTQLISRGSPRQHTFTTAQPGSTTQKKKRWRAAS